MTTVPADQPPAIQGSYDKATPNTARQGRRRPALGHTNSPSVCKPHRKEVVEGLLHYLQCTCSVQPEEEEEKERKAEVEEEWATFPSCQGIRALKRC